MTTAARKPKKVGTLFKLDPTLKAQAKAAAEDEGVSLTSVVEAGLRRYVGRRARAGR